MALDERLRRELERAGRPADPTGVYEHLIRRRERRRIARRVEVAGLAFVVLVGSTAGVLALARVFRGAGVGPAAPDEPSGLISYVELAGEPGDTDTMSRIVTARPDGSEGRVVYSTSGIIADLAWSPAGDRIAYLVHGHDQASSGLFILDVTTSQSTRITGVTSATVPTWSPAGNQIAFTDAVKGNDALFIANPDGSDREQVTPDDLYVAMPDWSPDGTRITFAGQPTPDEVDRWDIFVVELETRRVDQLTTDPAFDLDPDWSPDGSSIVFRSRRDQVIPAGTCCDAADEIYVMNANGTDQTRLTFDEAVDQFPEWSPNGAAIVFTSQPFSDSEDAAEPELVLIDPDGSNRRRILSGSIVTVSWVGDSGGVGVTPLPTPTSPAPSAGQDIGLGFPVCDVTSVEGSFVGRPGTAYVATRSSDLGGCPDRDAGAFQVLALDFTGDGRVEASYGPLECDPWCSAFATPDVNADGLDEVLVQNIQFSVAGLKLFAIVASLEPADGVPTVVPVTVTPPGSSAFGYQGFEGGTEPQFWLGGDEGTADAVRCEPFRGSRAFVSTTAAIPVDAPGDWDVTETWFVLEGDQLRVVDVTEFPWPANDAGLPFLERTGCGADLDPAT